MVIGEHDDRRRKLLHVREALHLPRAFACLVEGGQQDADEDRNDADDHKQFNEGERLPTTAPGLEQNTRHEGSPLSLWSRHALHATARLLRLRSPRFRAWTLRLIRHGGAKGLAFLRNSFTIPRNRA